MELHDLDLNLLVVFNQLLVDRRVSKAADNLGVSQPAVSNSCAVAAGRSQPAAISSNQLSMCRSAQRTDRACNAGGDA